MTRGGRRGIVRAMAPPSSSPATVVLGLRALRARQWLHFVPLPLAGVPAFGLVAGTCPIGPVLWACLAAALCLAFAYGLNAHTDRATDRSARKNPLVGAPAGLVALAPALACGALALPVAAASGGLAAAALSLAAGAVYSAGPRLKRLPVVGTLANAAIFAPLLGLLGGPRPPGFWGMSAVFAALLLQNQLIHERADEDEDRRAGARTTARAIGRVGVARAGRWLAAVGAAASLPVGAGAWSAWAAGAVGLVFGAWLSGQEDAARARRAHRWVALLAGASAYALGQGAR